MIGISDLCRYRTKFVQTWFLSAGRHEICLVPRRVQITPDTIFADFAEACRRTWRDLDDGGLLDFQVVQHCPPGLPSTLDHVIIAQGDFTGFATALFSASLLPPLRRQRAVMYRQGITVADFFRCPQHPDACRGRSRTCYLKFQADGREVYKESYEPLAVFNGAVMEGNIRIMNDEDDSDEGDDSSNASTILPDDEVENFDYDNSVLMSSQPLTLQFEENYPMPWMEQAFDEELQQEEDPQDDQPPISFADNHMDLILGQIAELTGESSNAGTPWIAATFGLGLIDLGRRDVHFDPGNMMGLLDDIHQVWRDHAAYGDLTVYGVYPQPVAVLGARTIALLVVVETAESLDVSIRNTLVIEQASSTEMARASPYAARLISETSAREILLHLDLHLHCPPFSLRTCYVRLGTTVMERNQFYEFDHGTLCRVWIGAIPPQVQEATQRIHGVEHFFMQVQSFRELREDFPNVVCHVHGVSPGNRPMGYRQLVIPVEWIYELEWIDEMVSLWPFGNTHTSTAFVQAATPDINEVQDIVFHFIVGL